MRRSVFGSRLTVAFAVAGAFAVATGVRAQPGGADSPRQQVNRGFDRSAPAVGQALPDVAGYDADGRPLRLSSLKGSPAVLVFGCLT